MRKNPGEFCHILVYVFSFDAFVTVFIIVIALPDEAISFRTSIIYNRNLFSVGAGYI